jgi:hypothetical protein
VIRELVRLIHQQSACELNSFPAGGFNPRQFGTIGVETILAVVDVEEEARHGARILTGT